MPDLTDLQTLPIKEWDERLIPVLRDMRDCPLNVHKLLANQPALLEAWWQFRNYAVAGGSLDKRCLELVILRTAVHTGAWYEWAAHVERGLKSGLTIEEIERILDNPGSPAWADSDALLLQAVDQFAADQMLRPETRDALSHFLDDRQLLDLIAIQSVYLMLGSLLNTWDVDLEAQVQQALPDSVTRERFEAARP